MVDCFFKAAKLFLVFVLYRVVLLNFYYEIEIFICTCRLFYTDNHEMYKTLIIMDWLIASVCLELCVLGQELLF